MAGSSGCGSSSRRRRRASPAPAIPASTLANTRQVERPDRQLQRRRPGSRLDAAADRGRAPTAATPRPRSSAKASIYSQDLDSNVQAIDLDTGEVLWTKKYERARATARTASSSPTATSSAPPPTEAFALDQKTGKEVWSTQLTAQRAAKASTWRPATTTASSTSRPCRSTADANLRRRRRRHPLGARRARPGRNSGTSTPCRRASGATRRSTPAAASGTRPPSTARASIYFGTGNPAPFPGTPQVPVGLEPARARTSTPTRWSSSTRRPARWTGTTSRPRTTSTTGTSRTRRSWSTPAARNWRSAPASRASSSPLDAKTGKPVWKRPVGNHNGHDDDGLLRDAGRILEDQDRARSSPARSAA